jgi:hypothetical protein
MQIPGANITVHVKLSCVNYSDAWMADLTASVVLMVASDLVFCGQTVSADLMAVVSGRTWGCWSHVESIDSHVVYLCWRVSRWPFWGGDLVCGGWTSGLQSGYDFFWPSRPLIVCIRHNVNTWFRKRSSPWRCLQNSQMTISKEVCHFYQVAQFWSLWDKTWTRRSQKRANSNTRFKVPD